MPSPTSAALRAVWGSAADDVYAVGVGVVLHYDGKHWTHVAVHSAAVLGRAFNAVWGASRDDVYVGGDRVLHYDGKKWSEDPPVYSHYAEPDAWRPPVTALGATRKGQVLAVTGPLDVGGGMYRTIGNGCVMSRSPSPRVRPLFYWGRDVQIWSKGKSDGPQGLNALWVAPTGEVFVAGDGGQVHQYLTAEALPAPVESALTDLAASEDVSGLMVQRLGEWATTHRKSDVRRAAVQKLGRVIRDSGSTPDMIATLVQALGDKSDEVQEVAGRTFGWVGAAAVPALLEVARDPEPKSKRRVEAIRALGFVGPPARDAVPLLIEALGSKDPWERWTAASALGGIGPDARSAIPALLDADPFPAAALADIGATEEGMVMRLIAILEDKGSFRSGHIEAARALANFDDTVVSRLAQGLAACKKWDQRQAFAIAIGSLGPRARAALPALIGALEQRPGNWAFESQDGALETLVAAVGQMGPIEAEHVRNLLPCRGTWAISRETDDIFRRNAAVAVDALARLLSDPEEKVRKEAAKALGAIGPEAAKALPALSTARQDKEEGVRKAAEAAIVRLQ